MTKEKINDVLTNNSFAKIGKNYYKSIILYSILTIIFFVSTILLVTNLFFIKKPIMATYLTKGGAGYKINLIKEEDSNKIDSLDLDYNYYYKASNLIDIDFIYDIKGNLIIKDENGTELYTKDYIFVNETLKTIQDKTLSIKDKIIIDYDKFIKEYNTINSAYGINTNADLIVYMNVVKKSDNDLKGKLTDTINVKIPIVNNSDDIKVISNNIDDINTITLNYNNISINKIYAILIIFTLGLTIFYAIKDIRLIKTDIFNDNIVFDKWFRKILRNKNGVFIEKKSMPSFNNKEVIKLKTIDELFNIRDEYKLPVYYHIISKHEKTIFYIEFKKKLYTYTLKDKFKLLEKKKRNTH